jgi:hypothetical protein
MAASALKEIEDHGNPASDPTYVLRDKKRLKDDEFQPAISKLVDDTLSASDAALRFNFDVSKEELIGKKIGLKMDVFEKCLSENKYLPQVKADMEEGRKINVKSTPTFFVNGQLVNGAQPLEVFSELIDEALLN